jgi:hypothetical protein
LLNTAPQLGTALGVAAFVTVAAVRTDAVAARTATAGLVEGYRAALHAAAILAVLAAVATLALAAPAWRTGQG